MINIDLHELIYIIPELISLFLSGFIFMTLFNWLTKIQMETYIVGIWSLIISTLIKTFCTVLHSVILKEIDFDESLKILIYVIIAIILVFLTIKIRDSKWIEKILSKTNRKTINNDILDDVIDPDKRTMVVAYLKDSSYYYIGAIRLHEEKGIESYIALIEYCLCNKETDKIICDYSEQKSCAIINLQDIERMELIYEENSEKWRWLNKYNKNKEQEK